MANKRIIDLDPAPNPLADTDVIILSQDVTGQAYQIEIGDLVAFLDIDRSYYVPFGFTAVLVNSEKVLLHVLACDIEFPANFVGAVSYVGTVPTATTVLTVADNGSTIGTISIATSGVATFATSGGTAKSVVAGHLLSITNQASADVTFANAAFTLKATKI